MSVYVLQSLRVFHQQHDDSTTTTEAPAPSSSYHLSATTHGVQSHTAALVHHCIAQRGNMPAHGKILLHLTEKVNALANQEPIRTKDFCEACQALEPFFDNLGAKLIDARSSHTVIAGALFHFAKAELVHKVRALHWCCKRAMHNTTARDGGGGTRRAHNAACSVCSRTSGTTHDTLPTTHHTTSGWPPSAKAQPRAQLASPGNHTRVYGARF